MENPFDDTYFMKKALQEAEVAFEKGEVPVGAVIVIESTISPGSIDKYIRPEIERMGYEIGKDINLVHAPERIIPGNMIYELENNSRTIGADSLEVAEKIQKLYTSFWLSPHHQ